MADPLTPKLAETVTVTAWAVTDIGEVPFRDDGWEVSAKPHATFRKIALVRRNHWSLMKMSTHKMAHECEANVKRTRSHAIHVVPPNVVKLGLHTPPVPARECAQFDKW